MSSPDSRPGQKPPPSHTTTADRAFNDPDPTFVVSDGSPEALKILHEQGVDAWLAWVEKQPPIT